MSCSYMNYAAALKGGRRGVNCEGMSSRVDSVDKKPLPKHNLPEQRAGTVTEGGGAHPHSQDCLFVKIDTSDTPRLHITGGLISYQ